MLTLPKGYDILKSDHVYCTRCYLNSHVNYVGVQGLMYVCMYVEKKLENISLNVVIYGMTFLLDINT